MLVCSIAVERYFLPTSQETNQARANPSFWGTKQVGGFVLPAECDGNSSQVYPGPSIKFAGTHLHVYTWVEIATVRGNVSYPRTVMHLARADNLERAI